MRLSPNKIEFLAEELLATIERHPQIHIQTNSDLVFRALADVIFDDMKREEALDAEVDEILEQYEAQIRNQELDYGALRAKIKRELARKKGIIL